MISFISIETRSFTQPIFALSSVSSTSMIKINKKPNKPSQRQVPISGTGNDTPVKELITVVLGLFVPHGISRCSHTLQLQYHHSYLTIISSLITNDSFPSLSFVSNRSRIIIAIPHWVISMTACFFPLFACWRIQLDNSHLYSLTVFTSLAWCLSFRDSGLYGVVPKGLLTFLGFFLCNAECSPCWALPEYIRALTHLACLRVFSVTPWVLVYRLYRVRRQGQSDKF